MTNLVGTGIAKYAHLRGEIVRRITSGIWAPDAKIPTEEELCKQFGISRTTVRNALRDLARTGVILRKPGVGTFVSPPRLHVGLSGLTLTGSKEPASAPPITHRVLSFEYRPVPPTIAAYLDIEESSRILRVRRVGIIEGIPTSLETAYFPESLTLGVLQRQDFTSPVFVEILQNRIHAVPGKTQLWLSAAVLRADDAKALGHRPGSPVIAVYRRTVDILDRPLIYAESLLASPGFRFYLEFGI